jgi:parvulin-like peptidyl-prolyl isomerase
LLEYVIKEELQNLTTLEAGEEKSSAIDDLVKLYKLKIEEDKNQNDLMEKVDARENEVLLKEKQLNQEKKNGFLKLGLEAAGIILPLVFYAAWMTKGFKFEETGTYTSTTFRNLFGGFKPKK